MIFYRSFDIINKTKKQYKRSVSSVMNNYNKIISNMEEKIKNFSNKISKGIETKKKRDFVFEMIYGLLASSSCHLSEIGRSLNENITLKALVKRLSRNLDEFNNGKEIESVYEDVRNKIIFENYEEEIKNTLRLFERSVFFISLFRSAPTAPCAFPARRDRRRSS